MKRGLPIFLTLRLLVVLVTLQVSGFSQTSESTNIDNPEQDDAAPVSRVARLSFVEGDVSFLRAGVTEWAPAVANLPLLEGDQVFAARGARAEIQLGRDDYIRLSENTELTIAQLSENAVQLEVTEGTAVVRMDRLTSALGRFEVDTPNSAVLLSKDGLYRIDVRGEKQSELNVRGGEAEVSTDEGTFRVLDGHRLSVDSTAGGRIELALAAAGDDWDQWSYERDTAIARNDVEPDDVLSYETSDSGFYGASDLSSYGTWTNYSGYGRCWLPRVGANWAPYRLGQWIWIPAAGWTWLSSEPWGWAPYHYGRWSYLSGLGWAWIPGFGGYASPRSREYHWRPALVYFFNWSTPSRNYVGWHPLAPGERWHRPDRHDNDGHPRGGNPSRDGRRRPGDGDFFIQPARPGNGTTIMPVEGFTHRDGKAGSPGSPGREHSGWIDKGARAGLPDLKPTPVAVSPVLGDGDRRKERRIAIPPDNVIARPIVTRNPAADNTLRVGPSRERRLVSPPDKGHPSAVPAFIDHSEPGTSRSSKPRAGSDNGNSPPQSRPPSSTPATGNDEGTTKSDRKRRDDNPNSQKEARPKDRNDERSGSSNVEISLPRQEQPRTENREQVKQERRQQNEQQAPPRSENREEVKQERRQQNEQQAPPRSENREQVKQERRQQNEQQAPPRSENREQVKQERRQEREQRPQSQEQGKKP